MNKDEVTKAVVNILADGDKRKVDGMFKMLVFSNRELFNIYNNSQLKNISGFGFEKVCIYRVGSHWELTNQTRREGYELSETSKEPLPTRINEKDLIKNIEKLRKGLGIPFENFMVNMIITKVPRKVNYRVAYLKVLKDPKEAWVF